MLCARLARLGEAGLGITENLEWNKVPQEVLDAAQEISASSIRRDQPIRRFGRP